ncbi:hypothetical protein DP939_32345 [Spongiactinospora rosea]|uniref:Trypsin-like peptidase n=1 Tax=Spongiactinospora rosea TaxID=2248750 RepID=A0A366LQ38_9ACTN|nr:hypothetical protein DP939_32345 [Spongiactinospora rosea]
MAGDVVLTAAHVIEHHQSIHVRFPGGSGRKVPARWLWSEGDIAVLALEDDDGAGDELQPVPYGLVEKRGGGLACGAVGFPAFKMRDRRRDSVQLSGTIYPLSNLATDTLHIVVDNAPGGASVTSWQGMSGAAVFVGSRLVGVVTEVFEREGPRHLTARRAEWDWTPRRRDRIGYHRPVSVNPAPPRDLGMYTALVRDLAPAGGLRDRERELAELAAFCSGEEVYQHWQGEPWSGKTALMSAFVLDPPPRSRVAAFFVRGRLGHQHGDVFLQAVCEQLLAIAGESPGVAAGTFRSWHLSGLLERAADRCLENGERLLLVVDGLDEGPGVAALLPRRPPDNLRVLVTGRPRLELPADLPPDHPLRTCRVRTLTPTGQAAHREYEATSELGRLLGTRRKVTLLGFLAAAGDGLTARELGELAGMPRGEVESLLDGPVVARTAGYASDAEMFVFAHETLLRTTEHELAADLPGHRARIHEWADSYRARGWPRDTPQYLLGAYGGLLTDTGDASWSEERLTAYALDAARHERMTRLVGGEAAALREIAAARRPALDRPRADLAALVRLAIAGDRVHGAGASVPAELPVLWARLGHGPRAASLAQAIMDPSERARALAAVAKTLAGEGDPATAETVARTIEAPERRAWALAAIVHARATAGDLTTAESLAESIRTPERQAWALAAIARASPPDRPRPPGHAEGVADARPPDAARLLERAEEAVQDVVDLRRRAWALAALAEAAAVCGDVERAERLADRIPLADHRVRALSAILKATAGEDPALTRAVLGRAEATAQVMVGVGGQGWALSALAEAVAHCGDTARAEAMARGLPTPYERSHALAAVAGVLTEAGDTERAERVADSAPVSLLRAQALAAVAEGIAGRGERARASRVTERAAALAYSLAKGGRGGRALVAVARSFGACGDGRAEQVARSIDAPHYRVQALIAVAGAALERGEQERALALAGEAEDLARSATPASRQAQALVALAQAVRDPALAETFACAIPRPAVRARILVEVIRTIAASDPAKAEAVARARFPEREERERALTAVAEALAVRGDFDRAERLALSLRGATGRAQALATLARALPDPDRAWAVAGKIPHADRRGQSWAGVIEAMGAAGSLGRAVGRRLRALQAPDQRAQALIGLARVAAGQGRAALAGQLAEEAEPLIDRTATPGRKVKLLAALVKVHLRTGREDQARRLARRISPPEAHAAALAEVAAASAVRGRVNQALRVIRRIEATEHRARAYVTLVKALADGGEPATAASIARRSIPTADHMARALAVLIRADPGGGRVAAAAVEQAGLLVPARVTNPGEQLMAFTDLVRVIADGPGPRAAGPLADKVAAMAETVEDPERRAQIQIALARAADPDRARRLLADVLTGPSWAAALAALGDIDPDALAVAAGELRPPPDGGDGR